ncbi:ABC transporter B family member 11-like isoform X2 [Phoenix dactylifera]|uniref:ABC transporter B family member 11-like isoform X2 n=1 Tax=Phoenix dactylifera TaxID=42345 RepID=A0A8B8J4X2_PHODC|nr:ABC transporter B family member 11-like isoform X2 [Phoenix dactylifera]
MAVGTVAAVANGISMSLVSYVFGQLVNAFGFSSKASVVHEVSKVVVKFVYLAAGSGVASVLQVSCWMVTAERQATRIRGLYLKALLRQDIAFFDNETTTGEAIERITGDTALIQDAIGPKAATFVQLVSTFFGGFIIAFTRGWLLSLVMLSSFPPIVIAFGTTYLLLSKLSIRGRKAYAEAGSLVEQTLGSIRTVVSFTSEKRAMDKYSKFIKVAYRATVHEGAVTGLGTGFMLFILFCSYGLAVWYGSKLIIEKSYNGGVVMNVIEAIVVGGMSLGQTSPCLNAFAAAQAAAYKMFETINRKPGIDAYDINGIELEDMKGDIELKDIYFSYPARPDQLIFDGFSLRIPSGRTMALVGESGSGKSTVISLVERFYDPQAGEVLIDGVDLKSLRLGWIRQKMGLVSQEPVLFDATIKENIAYGKEEATLEDIMRALELANAAKFVDMMPEGLDTVVGGQGAQLSGGQKQRIAIARAILKNPKILLLDEATSALDAESERIVQDALVRIMSGRTTIVVAHRLSTVRNSDTISVLHHGKLVEQGSHAELIKDVDGTYSQLVRLQESSKQAEEPPVDRSPSRGSSLGGSIVPYSSKSFEDEDKEEEQDDEGEVSKGVPVRRLASLNKPELPILLLGSTAAALHGAIFPVFGFLISRSIKTFYEQPHEQRKDARFWTLMYALLGVCSLIMAPAQYYFFAVAGGNLIKRIRSLLFERVVHQEISWFDEPSNSSGAIGARLSTDASTVRALVGDSLAVMVQNLSSAVTGFLIAMVANWRLALIVSILGPLVGLQGYVQMKLLEPSSADAKVMYEDASRVASDAVRSIRTVASFCAEQRILDTYEKKCRVPMKHGVRRGAISGFGFGFSNLVLYCSYALCFYVGAIFVHDGHASFSQVFTVYFALSVAAIVISQTTAFGPDSAKAKESTASIFAILDRTSKIDSSTDEGTVLANVRGDIEFQHVFFKYPARPDVQIFRDLCLRIPSRKTVALVGESGSGKSTAIALLERFYDPDSGKILLDGVAIQKFRVNWLRRQIGLVSQEPVLFNDTIHANIAYGKQREVSEEEIIAAAEIANAHWFISALPQGYDTNVGERGMQLSGGQKQRIAIARAVIKNPKILLLDEATSALDVESEHVVQEALNRVMVGRSTVVVAHRLSTIKGADIIALVKNGLIVEQGRHEALMELADGAYASLVAVGTSSR